MTHLRPPSLLFLVRPDDARKAVIGRTRSQTVVGLSIEPGRIAAARVGAGGALAVEGGGSAELAPGVVRDGEVADPVALATALKALWEEHKDLDKRVRIGVANARIVVRSLLLPPIEDPKERATAVRFHAAEAISLPIADAILDHHVVGLVDTPNGPRERIIVVAARRDMIEAVRTAVLAAGLKPTGIDLAAFGMIRALALPEPGDGAELFLSVGGLTNLAIAEHGVCTFTRVTGGGLDGIALEIAEHCKLTIEEARGYLHDVGLEADLRDLADRVVDEATAAQARAALIAGVRRIAAEIRASLEYHDAHAQQEETAVRRVVLTGPAVGVAGFAIELQVELGMQVHERVVAAAKHAVLSPLDAGRMTVAAGLAVDVGRGS